MATAVGFLVDTCGEGGLIHFGAADIFTLISIQQLKANKHKEQICTSELEVLTLSKAHNCKKKLAVFPSPAGISLIKLSVDGKNLITQC